MKISKKMSQKQSFLYEEEINYFLVELVCCFSVKNRFIGNDIERWFYTTKILLSDPVFERGECPWAYAHLLF